MGVRLRSGRTIYKDIRQFVVSLAVDRIVSRGESLDLVSVDV